MLLGWTAGTFVKLSDRKGICVIDGVVGRLLFGGEDGGGCVLPASGGGGGSGSSSPLSRLLERLSNTIPTLSGAFNRLFARPSQHFSAGAAAKPAQKPVFGGFDLLIASPAEAEADAKDCASNQQALASTLRRYVDKYITDEDRTTLRSITEQPFNEALLQPLLEEDGCVLGNVLSNERFVAHPLNSAGLHLLRCVLAERMTDARRDTAHPDYAAWIRDGYLLKDYNALLANGDGELRAILAMTSGGGSCSSKPLVCLQASHARGRRHAVPNASGHVPLYP